MENAIKHAFKKTTQPVHIKISARPVADNQVQIQVQSNSVSSTFTIVCSIQIVKEAQPYADFHRG